MIKHEKDGLVYYRFESLERFPWLLHGVFTKHGGEGPDGLNVASGDHADPAQVEANLGLMAQALGFDQMFAVKQVHGDRILLVEKHHLDPEKESPPDDEEYDAMITAVSGVGLLLKLGDCQGIILFDPDKLILTVVHNGWRGSVAGLLGKTINRLRGRLGVNPANLIACISPSLGPVNSEFINYRSEFPFSFLKYKAEEGPFFDFWTITKDQLVRAGLKPENVETPGIDTFADADFYSYRRDKSLLRFGLVAGIAGSSGE